MRKRFIIMHNDLTADQQAVFLDWIKQKQAAWWHWLDNAWLIIDYSGELTAQIIRDQIKGKDKVPPRSLVIELRENAIAGWSGSGPSGGGGQKDMFAWLRDKWRTKVTKATK